MTITGLPGVTLPAVPARTVRRHTDVVVAAGLLVLVAGTFLPWLRSGTVERTSYSADGMLRTLLDQDGLTAGVLRAWPFLSMLCAVALGLLILRLSRTGTVLAALCALAAGVVCVRVLLLHSSVLVGVATIGPAVTLAGCAVVLGATVVTLLRVALAGAPSHSFRRIR